MAWTEAKLKAKLAKINREVTKLLDFGHFYAA